MPLIRLLTKAGLLDAAKTDELRGMLEEGSSSCVDIVLQHVDERTLAEVLSRELALPLVSVTPEAIEAEAVRLVPRELVRRHEAVPVRCEGNGLVVAFANPLDYEGIRAIEFAARRRVRVAVAPVGEVRDGIYFAYEFQKEVAKRRVETAPTLEEVEILEPPLGERGTELEQLLGDEGGLDSSATRVVELILAEGLTYGASDVHIEPAQNSVNVRYRVDGVMENGVVVPKTLQAKLAGRLKVMAGLDIAEHRKPQDGSLSVRYEQRRVDVRVSILPTPLGEKIVLRLLDTKARSPSLDEMGFDAETLRILRKEIHRPEGMVLITGPTGSGKTTTAHAILSEIAKRPLNVVTIENPVEYRLKGITQVEIHERQGITFAGTLRSILRQDPDVIFVGEIRDAETAEIALRASHTGHLVISTVHTIDAASSISRLLDLGADPWMVAGSLRLVLAQRLMREICQECRAEHRITEDEHHRLGAWALDVETSSSGRGCRRCRSRGYAGRFAVSEAMPISSTLRPLLESRAPETEIRETARAEGVVSLQTLALAAVKAGRTTIEELLRVIPPEAGRGEPVQMSSAAPASGDPAAAATTSGPERLVAARPRAASDPAPPPTVSPPAIAVSGLDLVDPTPNAFNILVVDDERMNRTVIGHCLGKMQLPIRVIAAENASLALALMQQETIHLAIIDLMMPGMSGIELCERIRADPRGAAIPIFMLTGVDDTEQKTGAFAAGIDDYIAKPVNAAELAARVSRALLRTYGQPAASSAGPARAEAPLATWSDWVSTPRVMERMH